MTRVPHAEHRSLPTGLWLALIAVPAAILLCLELLDRALPVDARWRHDTAWALFSDAAVPPSSGAEPVALPDRGRPGGQSITSTWYRFEVTVDGPQDRPWAVYVREPESNLVAYVNGEYVGDGGSLVPPVAEHGAALYFEFPGALLNTGSNRVDLRNVAQWPETWMNSVHIGPADLLRPAYERTMAVRVLALHVVIALAVVTGLIMVLVFLLHRREEVFGWLGLAILAWVVHALAAVLPQGLLPDRHAWIALTDAMLGWFVLFAMLFVHRFLGERRVRVERVAAWTCGIGTSLLIGVAVTAGRVVHDLVNWLWLPCVHAAGLYMIISLARDARAHRGFDVQLLLLAAVTGEVVGLRDFLVFSGLLPGSPTLYLNHAIGLELVAFGVVLLRRWVRALHELDLLNRDLEAMIARKTEEAARNMTKLMEMQRLQAVNAERERVMRDVREGLGGRLVEALAMTAGDPALKAAEPMLRGILDELRLIVDAIEPADGDLLVVLGMLRSRMSKRVEACDVRIEWDVDDLPPLRDLGPHKMLHVLRIVQEAITNALRHAEARTLTIRTRVVSGQPESVPGPLGGGLFALVEVADDGRGIGAAQSAGHGLRNMHLRAEQIGAALHVAPRGTGTSVRLWLPVDAQGARPD